MGKREIAVATSKAQLVALHVPALCLLGVLDTAKSPPLLTLWLIEGARTAVQLQL